MNGIIRDAFGGEIKVGSYFVYAVARSGSVSYCIGRVVSLFPMRAVTASRWCNCWRAHKDGKPIPRDTPSNMIVVDGARLGCDALEVLG